MTSSPETPPGRCTSTSTSATSGFARRNASPAGPSAATETRNGPRSNCIAIIRPMYGSSSMTSTWCGAASTLEGVGDLRAVPLEVVQERADVGAPPREQQQLGVLGEVRDDRGAPVVLEDPHLERAPG